MLKVAHRYVPPTPEHEGIYAFMIEQLTTTIDYDGNTEYYEKELQKIEKDLKNLDPVILRNNAIIGFQKDIAYYLAEYGKEVDRCRDSNKWVEDFINSLPNE